jgi:hypothetical protein
MIEDVVVVQGDGGTERTIEGTSCGTETEGEGDAQVESMIILLTWLLRHARRERRLEESLPNIGLTR